MTVEESGGQAEQAQHEFIKGDGAEPDVWVCNVNAFGFTGSEFKHLEYCPRCGKSVDTEAVKYTECEMCPEISDELAPELPFEAEHTAEIMGEEVEVCGSCKRELEKGKLPYKEGSE